MENNDAETANAPSERDDPEEENRAMFREATDPTRVLRRDDPCRNRITREEHRLALAIKARVEAVPELDNLSDLMYLQLAIVCRDDWEDAVHRCHGMQAFREEYRIVDSAEQGNRHLQKIVGGLFPREFLMFDFSERDGIYVFVLDQKEFEPTALATPELVDDCMRCWYYFHLLFHPDVECVRRGVTILLECEDFVYRRDVMRFTSNLFSQWQAFYPFRVEARQFHTGVMAHTFWAILKRILPRKISSRVKVGYTFDGNLADHLLVQSLEAANARVLRNMRAALKRRYELEQTFSLAAFG